MRILLLLCLCFQACPDLLTAQPGMARTPLAVEQLRFQAMTNRDTARLRGMLDDKLIYLHSNGLRESKDEHIANIGSGTIVYKTMTRKVDPEVRQYGKIALITGKVLVDGQFKGKDFTLVLLYTAVYRREKKFWRLLNWQSTRLENE